MNKKTSNFLQGTLKQNLDKITESYHQRNGIVTGTGFQTGKVNEDSNSRQYYERELQSLNTESEYGIKIHFADGDGNKTKWMDINRDSVYVFIDFLENLEILNK